MTDGPQSGVLNGADGLTIAVDHYGDRAGPLVLLVHGGGQTRSVWGDTATYLAGLGCHVIAMDLRGHGDSSWSPVAAYALADYGADIAAIARSEVHGQGLVLVGASLGGLACVMAAGALHGLGLRGLVLADIVPRARAAGAERIRQFTRQAQAGFASLDEVVQAVASLWELRPSPSLRERIAQSLRTGADGRLYLHWDPARIRMDAEAFSENELQAVEQVLARGRFPIALIQGLNSEVVDQDGVAALKRIAPRVLVSGIPGAGHRIVREGGEAVTSAVTYYLADWLGLTRSVADS